MNAQFRLGAPRQLPAAGRLFAGRVSEVRALWETLGPTDTRPAAMTLSVICGMPGAGKTALAVRWAYEAAERFPDGQLFINLHGMGPADTPLDPARVIQWFLAFLGLPAQFVPPDPEAQESLYRSVLADKRMLIVLDNAHDADQVRRLLPGSPGCHVVVTSRNRLTSLGVAEGAQLLSLDVLTEPDACELLASRLGASRLAAEPRAARDLIELCGRLPLALAIIATRAAAGPSLSLAALADELRGESSALDALETGDARCSLRAAFCWSYRELTGPAARMLGLLAGQADVGITASAAAGLAGIPAGQAGHVLAELANANLLAEPHPGRYTMHRLLRAYALERAATAPCDRLGRSA